MPGDWSRAEVEAIVSDYMDMLAAELRNLKYDKTAHRRRLSALLSRRSDGSIERKHQNISAILIENGYPPIDGYKPLSNYQHLLFEVVNARLARESDLTRTVASDVEMPAPIPEVEDILACLEDPLEPRTTSYGDGSRPVMYKPEVPKPRVNYLEREARNASLGHAGELFVANFERARLIRDGKHSLADGVEHISLTSGDGAGFDVKSFEANGRDRLIEVKTTAYGKYTPFFVSRNEVDVSLEREDLYHLYRVFKFRKDPRLFTLNGPIERVCALDAIQFRARVGVEPGVA